MHTLQQLRSILDILPIVHESPISTKSLLPARPMDNQTIPITAQRIAGFQNIAVKIPRAADGVITS